MKMKKITLVFLIIMMVTILAACGGSETSTSTSGESEQNEGNGESGTGSENGSSEQAEGETVVLKVAFMSAPEHAQYSVIESFGQEVEEATNGKVKFELYPGGALAAAAESYDAAVTGIADVAWVVQGYTPGRFPLTGAIALPFIEGDTAAKMSKTLQQFYEEFPDVQKEYSDVKVLYMHAGDPYHLMTSGKQVKTVDDLKGMKLRTNSTEATQLVEKLGGTAVSIPLTDTYDALQKGVVDGVVGPLSAINDFNLGDVLDYITLGNFFNTAFVVAMNKETWEGLDPETQQIIDSLAGEKMAVKAGEAFDVSVEKNL